jgi:thiol-disulfide isomerase/thioredoxin
MKLLKNNLLQWALLLLTFGFLFFTPVGMEVRGQVQGLILKTGINAPSTKLPADLNAQPLVPEMDLLALDGKKVKLSSLKGKVIFMNLWATWCGPCIAEMPSVHNLYQKLANDKDVAFVMLAVNDDEKKVKSFIKKKAFTFPVYTLVGDMLPPAFETDGIPTTFVITPDGKIAQKIVGSTDYDTDKFKNYLLSLKKKK